MAENSSIARPYAEAAFELAKDAGQLAGNHFITLTSGTEKLADLGRMVLWQGAQRIRFEEV